MGFLSLETKIQDHFLMEMYPQNIHSTFEHPVLGFLILFFVILNKNAATCWNAQGKRERIPLYTTDPGIPWVRSMDPDTQNQVFFTTAKILVIVLNAYLYNHHLIHFTTHSADIILQ